MSEQTFKRILKLFAGVTSGVLLALALTIWYGTRPPVLGGDFSLNHRGQTWDFSKDPKKLNLLYVGYAKCPDVCPMSLSVSGQAFKNLSPAELAQTRLIFVSVDSEHDTPESVAEYASQFYPDFIGLTGNAADIQKTVSLFGASFMVEKNARSYLGYSIAHTDKIFYLDRKGQVIDFIPQPRSSEEILSKIKEHL